MELHRLSNAFVVAYALDALLSLADEALRAATGASPLTGIRSAVALVVLLGALGWLPLLALAARLPAGLLLALSLSALWLGLGAAPVPLWIESAPARGLALAGFQAACAAAAFGWTRYRTGRFVYPAGSLAGPGFSWRRTLGWCAGYALLLLPASLLYLGVGLATWAELGTARFVRFDWAGISLADRTYVRGDRELRLVGMMHLGEGDAYRELAGSFVEESTVVLAEGIRDVDARLESPPSFDRVARGLGLEAQDDFESYLEELEPARRPHWPVVWHADVDVGDLSPETVAWIDETGRIWNAGGPAAVLGALLDRSRETQILLRTLEHDILTLRNEHLLARLEQALGEYRRVVIPWGALHLPAIESSILDDGFELRAARQRRLISWLAVAAALLGGDGAAAPASSGAAPP